MSLFNSEMPTGLIYYPNWLTVSEHDQAVAEVDGNQFESTLARRVQHYGARYDYFSSEVLVAGSAPAIPRILGIIGQKLFDEKIFDQFPDQVIVNEYLSDQGIAQHIDRHSFGPVVATISLLESWHMQFISAEKTKVEVLLESCSLAVMTEDSRKTWSHGIAKRRFDLVGGIKKYRSRRLSLTYRTLK